MENERGCKLLKYMYMCYNDNSEGQILMYWTKYMLFTKHFLSAHIGSFKYCLVRIFLVIFSFLQLNNGAKTGLNYCWAGPRRLRTRFFVHHIPTDSVQTRTLMFHDLSEYTKYRKIKLTKEVFGIKGKIWSSGFLRIFTAAFLPFLAPARLIS